ncbi:uncharacterized protein N7487_011472 [Penicillium crustosum]|uniref:uncharacterized protein n=1 Tax=Penicillium crustosum TaxID=36656 RepID=UPI0023A3A852|nr:uncharacterized protein N7487_011472 [Penicillium crustosum]KAJ5393831.1 hypothetical protein N7487_011472 [Penicillium crustosum]
MVGRAEEEQTGRGREPWREQGANQDGRILPSTHLCISHFSHLTSFTRGYNKRIDILREAEEIWFEKVVNARSDGSLCA